MDTAGAKISGLDLVPTAIIKSGYPKPAPAPQPIWTPRVGAY